MHAQDHLIRNEMNNQQSKQHLVFGSGPAACWTASALVQQGASVMAVNRSGNRPMLMPASVTILKADVSSALDVSKIADLSNNVAVVYQMLNPPYSQWAELFPQLQRNTVSFAQKLGAKYVALENLYMLDHRSTMTERSAARPTSIKGQVRLSMHDELMTAHRSGSLKVATVRASDFYGPGVLVSAFGDRLFGPLVSGKAPSLMGDANQPHSVAYIADVGRAAATIGLDSTDTLLGHAWLAPHNPALTQGQWLKQVAEQLKVKSASLPILPPKVVKPWMLKMAGLFDKDAKALVEMMVQFQTSFVVDSSISQQQLGLQPTPLRTAIDETLDWYKQFKQSSLKTAS
jgi:nucleoside-diphosphate-sugar epimerase